jgi:Tfp pilus assembly protein PilF
MGSRVHSVILLTGLLLAGLSALAPMQAETSSAAARTYVGSGPCSRCHIEIANHFAKASMGHSLTRITPDFLKTLPIPASYYDPKSDHHIDVHAENGKLYQTEYQTSAEKDIFRNTHEMGWIIGTGENGFGALLLRGDYLFQAPLSYYSKSAQWNLSPGYENGDQGFNRAIVPGCIFCHGGRQRPIAGSSGKYENPPFTQTSIGCENCHGPGSAHVEAMDEGESYEKGKDPTIVNPARISSRLSDDICMSCHQEGDTRILQPGKTYQDFRPGTPLDRVLAILMVPPTRENPPRDDHVEHYYSMILSKCYRASSSKLDAQQMRCTSCHDPHVEPTSAEAPAYFNGKCMSCHTAQSCTAPAATRQQTTPADNCIGCHMPKRGGLVIAHTSLTNHRIVAQPDEPYPDATFEMTKNELPNLIHLDRVPGESAPPPAITLLQAYDQLKDQKPAYTASYLRVLGGLEKTDPNNALVQAALGHQALTGGKLDEAEQHLQQSLHLNPAQAKVYVDLSSIADQKGQTAEAVSLAQKAVLLEPFSQPLQKTLIARLISAKQYPEAVAAIEKYLENFPEDNLMRKMLAIAKE